jgi:hypothetical protein
MAKLMKVKEYNAMSKMTMKAYERKRKICYVKDDEGV